MSLLTGCPETEAPFDAGLNFGGGGGGGGGGKTDAGTQNTGGGTAMGELAFTVGAAAYHPVPDRSPETHQVIVMQDKSAYDDACAWLRGEPVEAPASKFLTFALYSQSGGFTGGSQFNVVPGQVTAGSGTVIYTDTTDAGSTVVYYAMGGSVTANTVTQAAVTGTYTLSDMTHETGLPNAGALSGTFNASACPAPMTMDGGSEMDSGMMVMDSGMVVMDAGNNPNTLTATRQFTVQDTFWLYQPADMDAGTPDIIHILHASSPSFETDVCTMAPVRDVELAQVLFAFDPNSPTITGSYPIPGGAAGYRYDYVSGQVVNDDVSSSGSVDVTNYDSTTRTFSGSFNVSLQSGGFMQGTFVAPAAYCQQ